MLQANYKAIIFAFRTTLFDQIDERIQYSYRSQELSLSIWDESSVDFGMNRISAVTLADDKITITADWQNFNLFSYENDSWTKTEVASQIFSRYESADLLGEELFTVRYRKADG